MNDQKYRALLTPREGGHVEGPGERDIILAAIEIFGQKGYAASGLREIAQRARVTAPLINYHFGNKGGLYLRCVEVVLGALTESAMQAVADDTGIVDAVRRFARAHVDFTIEHPLALRFALGMAYGPAEGQPDMEWSRHFSLLFAWATERFERAIAEGELRPRADTNMGLMLRHLFHIVHMEVFSAYERMRFADQVAEVENQIACGPLDPQDAVEDVVRQYFFGTGEVRDAH